LRRLDRFLLALLATSTKQNHEPVSIFAEIDPVTWAKVDFALVDASPHSFDTRPIAPCQLIERRGHLRSRWGIESFKPGGKR
jgi:hypothetical protein